ncbi:MAG TPA: YhdP family protein [Rudaea sp.]|jgi:uncharacterized protein (TIGR02099 family)|uniref:YhdP family protein n=1 Tax=Rudaea sp. TaxID=2136325 RepID=UPI002F930AEA
MTEGRRRLHRIRLWLSGLLAAAIIMIGICIGLIQLALPWVASHPEKVSALLSERLHRPVTIDRVDTHWERNGPLLSLTGLHLGAAKPGTLPLTIASAGIKLNFFAWLRRNTSWNEFRLAGIEVDLVRDVDGQWQLRGMDNSADDDKQGFSLDDNPLFGLGTLVLRDARLNIDDLEHDKHFKLGADEARLINQGDRHRLVTRVKNLATASPPIDAVIEYSSADHSGRAYLGGKDLDLAAILRGYPLAGLVLDRGKGRGQFWAWVEQGELTRVRAEIDLADMVLETRTAIALDDKHSYSPHISFDRVAFGARWQRETDGWSADIADLVVERQGVGANTGAAHLRRSAGSDENAPEYAATLSAIDIGAVTSTAMLVDTLPAGVRRWLYAGNPDGSLSLATLRYVDAQNYDVAASFDAFAWHSVDKLPGLSGFSGVLRGDQDALSVDLPRHNAVSVSVPRVFRQALAFSDLSGSIVAYRGDDAWRVETDALAYEGANEGKTYGGELRGAVEIADDGTRPTLDLYNLLTHAEVPASHLFWPINIMPPSAVSWLDRALAGGRIVGGRAVFRGNLADWPFRNNAGRFEGVAEIEDFRLKYLADWPAVEHGHALTDFVNTGLHVDIDAGTAQGNKINKASVDVTDYGEGTLDVNLSGQGAGRDLLGFIKATPLGTTYAAALQGVDIGGHGKVDFILHAPMKPIESFTLDGKAQLDDANLSDAKYALRFDKANGALRFNRSGFSADELATTFHDKPAKFSLAVGGYVANAQHVVEAKVETRLPVGNVLDYAPALNEYQKYTSGDANWTALFSADQDAEQGSKANDSGQRLTLTSDLRGVRIDLPQPLAKSADSALPLKLTLTLPFIGADLNLRLGDILTMRGRLPALTTPFVANVQFGGEAKAALPKSGMTITGATGQVDVSGWMDFASNGTGSNEGVLDRIDMHTPSVQAWDRSFGEGNIKLTTRPDTTELAFDGANIEGNLSIPRKDLRQRGISADLKRLYWPAGPEPVPGVAAQDDATSPLNPAAIPPLHIHIGDFHLGKATYGEATMESVPIADGMHFDQITTHSRDIDMRAHGDWTRRNGYHRSTFGIDLSAQNLGHMLDALGSPGLIDGGQIVAHVDASWAGPPSAFALNKINGGALKVNIAEGRIPDVELGAGRIGGLLNLAAIPRRLAFDFGDLFNKGYSFDSIAGTFTLTDGYAYTENLEVKSPTADMRLKGSMGLKTRDWDQIVEVTPHVGGSLLVGGALVGGPVGAAAGAVLQTVFKNQINAVTRVDYKVTGTWDKPSIVKVASVSANPKKVPANPAAATKKSTPAAG